MQEIDQNQFDLILKHYSKGKRTAPKLPRKADISIKRQKQIDQGELWNRTSQNTYQVDFSRLKLQPQPEGADLHGCRRGYLVGYTSEKVWFKSLHCNREWCAWCGLDYSIAHQRRVMKAWPRVLGMKGPDLGYLVITVPAELREFMKDREKLTEFRQYWKRKLRRGTTWKKGVEYKGEMHLVPMHWKIDQGFIRWHWAGEDHETWHPHLNILIPAGYLHPNLLRQLKVDFAKWMQKRYKLEKAPVPNIYYGYTKNKAKKKHLLNYITRPTLKIKPTKEVEQVLYNLKNTDFFGHIEPVECESADYAALVKNVDLETGELIQWKDYTPNKYTEIADQANQVEFTGGVWFIPADNFKPSKKLRPLSRKSNPINYRPPPRDG